MSASLIRRGLELLSDDVKDVSKGKKKKQQQKKKKKQGTPGSDRVMELVSTKRQGVTRQVKRLQGRLGPGKSKATVKDKRIKSAVEEFRKKQGKSHLSANLKYFTATLPAARESEAMKILNHSSGRQSRNRREGPVKKPKKEESLFTEEEFKKFQKEYFGRMVEDGK
ncbi:ribosomal protein S19 binding protein 1 [Mugil cephalus]|uniref:ribosomal protein S19 binding protein 1 n=1 Tax=Mugil cephalus TaxID=48193 RepID=UPI001FB68D93|nr:ribosomal protein S19 binding protein 1 [Mugil cephalus]